MARKHPSVDWKALASAVDKRYEVVTDPLTGVSSIVPASAEDERC